MISFTGVCAVKQFVRGKLNPEGLKNFVCATPEGLILDFEIHQGKGTLLEICDVNLGVGPVAVIRLTRGFTEQTVRNDGKVNVLQWFDQKPILLASTALGQHPTDNCERRSKKDSKYMLSPRPCIVKCYNDSMGGIMISYYRMSARTKKWTDKTIYHLIDLAIANSWILYREDKKKLGEAPKNILQFHA
ncbi:hypothetical protein JTB14_023915 [Gonioctena quinquepunctata]|nr:hypothetical protein JTB14_023915 [Gonioctena quinquepunctata]